MSRTDTDVYVYRDTDAQPGEDAGDYPAQGQAEHDAAYWYDLLTDDTAPKPEKARGPFEPLVCSGGLTNDAAYQQSATPAAAEPSGTELSRAPATMGRDEGPEERDEGPEETAHARARKPDQINDFYLTAEAIGEHEVDKPFDQLLVQQDEPISECFRQSAAVPPAVAGSRDSLPAEAEAEPAYPDQSHDLHDPWRPGLADDAGTPESAGVASEPPRAW